MKKNNLFLALVACSAVGFGSFKVYGDYTASNSGKSNLLLAENVLALSDCSGSSNYVTCYNTITEQESVMTLFCSDCNYYPDSAPRSTSGTSRCQVGSID